MTETPTFGKQNIIYIRDLKFVEKRLNNSKRNKVGRTLQEV